MDPDLESGSGSRRAKITHKNWKNKKFHVFNLLPNDLARQWYRYTSVSPIEAAKLIKLD
jgi:hypothetical protein